ncbi:recombinase family protein [Rhizobium sp. 57MFTsu3.2]|uniref:recombinase family protein n=1 Tax=Rhizobium sp. 57MFTsu3.2 TaxID=1048681 RepID=UPI00146B5AAF|nr:recombinase family protein [Rhizobium sp. 57MFTsu3.2]NMN71177.1 DNA invertase Pin-like site-specific DNA recombinase [Rhizobium sp. 57MFTsu3.2]
MRKIGYARVSTNEQHLDLQLKALEADDCELVFTDQGVSGSTFDRPGLVEALSTVQSGDMLIVWRLDRLGRSLIDLIQVINDLGKREVEFRSLNEAIDTSTSGGRLTFHIMAAMAEFERSIISERTKAGMSAARSRGSFIGRPPALTPKQILEARDAFMIDKVSLDDLAERYKVHSRTLLRGMKRSVLLPRDPGL